MNAKILTILEKSDSNLKLKLIYYLILPISIICEFITFKKYWKIIINEIDSSEDIIKWFDEQEFGFNSNKLYKKDIVAPDTFLSQLSLTELTIKIRGEFIKKIIELFRENLVIDIENYVSLTVDVEFAKNTNNSLKQYTVTIRYFRYQKIIENIKWLILWFILFATITIITKLYLIDVVKYIFNNL